MEPLITIVLALLGSYLFYHWKEKEEDAEEVERILAETKKLEEEKKNGLLLKDLENIGTHQLVLKILKVIGCQYEEVDDVRTRIVYQGETFLIDSRDDCLFINVYDPWWYELPMNGDIDDFARLQKAINHVNSMVGCTVLYTYNNEERAIGVHTMKNLIFIPQIPHLDNYLESTFADFFKVQRTLLTEIEKIKTAEVHAG